MNIRAHAAKTLAPVLRRDHSLQKVFDGAISALPARERPYFHELVFGCLRHYEYLDAICDRLLSKPLKKKDADIQALILLGLYQLRFMRTADHAAISESVEAAGKLKKVWAKKLLNAVLRNYLREQTQLEAELSDSALYNCPSWLVKKLQANWPEHWQQVLSETNKQPPLTVRINTHIQTRQQAQTILADAGVSTQVCVFSNYGLRLDGHVDINTLPGFKEGWLSVQDEAAQLAADQLDLQAGQRVLDACAAPGGKTCHILEAEPKLEEVLAIELDEQRGKRIDENLQRLGLSASVCIADACELDTWWDGKTFDRILIDAPCSATGVIRRHPDIKLLRRENDMAQLAQIQKNILSTLWQTLAPGGIAVYATCSIFKQENQKIIQWFTAAQDDAELLPIDADWGIDTGFGRQLFPQSDGHDGFFYAKLRKAL